MSDEQNPPIDPEALSDKSLETVRDILFGAQVREANQRDKELEALIKRSIDGVQKNLDKEVANIEKSIAKLSDQLDKERAKTAAQVDARFNDTLETIKSLEAATRTHHEDLHEQVNADRDDLEKRAKQWNEDLAQQLEMIHQQLLHAKTDRATLGELLHDLADSITADSE